ncbi:MAG: hypothetical protein CSA81_12125 [Acidobacteria bacterium]|nr:MAG: hypothetical protein CSA81_12125 [Acidobacteriota bacterium]
MFKMIKFFFKFIFFIVFVAVALIVAGNYQLVKSSSGFHVLEREDWGFSDCYVNTTDWSALDFAKNPRISTELFKDHFQALLSDTKKGVQNWWKDVSKDKNMPELQNIKKEFDSALDQLNRALKNNEIDIEKYKSKLKELKQKTERKIKKVMKVLKEE